MAEREGRPPMVANYAQNQSFEENGNAFGVLARPGDSQVPEDASIPENGIERLRNDRVRIYWLPIDWENMEKKGEIVETVVEESKWIRFYDPDFCPRPVIHMYPDMVTEQPDALLKSQDPDQVAGLGVYHQYLLYENAETKKFMKKHVQEQPKRMNEFVERISNEWGEEGLRRLKEKLDALDMDLKSSSSSSSGSSSSSSSSS